MPTSVGELKLPMLHSSTGEHFSEGHNMLLLILTIVLVLALFGSLPTWPHSRKWGYYPSGGISLIVLILLILFLMGRL